MKPLTKIIFIVAPILATLFAMQAIAQVSVGTKDKNGTLLLTNMSTSYATIINTNNQSIADATATPLSWNSNVVSSGIVTFSTNTPTKLLIGANGRYLMNATVRFASDNDGAIRWLRVRVSSNYYAGSMKITVPVGTEPVMQVYGAAYLTNGDFVEVVVQHDAGNSLNVEVDTNPQTAPRLSVDKIGD